MRYGEFVTKDTWFLTAGTFPTNNTNLDEGDEIIKVISSRFSLKRTAKGEVKYHYHPIYKRDPNTVGSEDGSYSAALWKTTNGGQSFTRQFSDEGKYYFNGVSCCSATLC